MTQIMAETSDFLPFFRSCFGSVVIVARAKFAWCHRHNNKPERSEKIKISREKQGKQKRGQTATQNRCLKSLLTF